ncbi:protein timeless homolog [Ctenocephalides felis]|uniref:protein timeless homolog n=1 Tax=Ctenocephalides felis TaxID=7515 RepID=UPI000E6E163B|nr:protein timeless homolog [Ctenocephalides felis]
MATLLTDLDATCANLGYHEPDRYYAEPDALQNLKHLIWILRRDSETHDYRRHLGRAKVLRTDLLPMLVTYSKENELSDVLLRLLVNLTNPALLLYREQLPTDGPGRKIYLEIIEHLQSYKAAFVLEEVWIVLSTRLQEALDIDWAERSEDHGLVIERILVLARNILQVPASPDAERRADNDASLHDQVLWGLHQSGLLDIVLYITNTQQENQYHLHAIEIISLMYREQNVEILANSELQRSTSEKERDEQELVAARKREQAKINKSVGATRMPPSGRHSRFGGTFVFQNIKSISDNDMICHKVVAGPEELNLNKLKNRVKKPKNKIVIDTSSGERRSAFSVRLFLREFCLEFLASSYNTVMRDVRRIVTSSSSTPDESYLLWAVRFFMEFNRLNGFRLDYISETLSTTWFHWVLSCSDKYMEMAVTDKKNMRLWSRRLHLALQAYREFLMSIQALVKLPSDEAKALALSLQSNVFYVMEYRETVIHLLMHFDESKNSRSYLKDLIETAHIFSRMLEKYCKAQGMRGTVMIQQKKKQKKKSGTKKSVPSQEVPKVSPEDRWLEIAQQVTAVLTSDGEQIPTDMIPFDVTSEVPIDDQKEDCVKRIQNLLKQENFEQAIGLLRAAREVWPEHDYFGAMNVQPEEEQMILYDIFVADIGNKGKSAYLF